MSGNGSEGAPPKRGSQRGRAEIGVREVLALRAKGFTLKQIAERRGVTKQRIHTQLKELLAIAEKRTLQEYREKRVELLTGAELNLLASLVNPTVIEKASLNNRAYTFTQLHQARRLEEGQSTANVGIHVLLDEIERPRSQPQDVVVEAEGIVKASE